MSPLAIHRADGPEPPVLGRLGGLVARLAGDSADIERAQALRHAVFVEEGGARREGRECGLEADALDAACDHLLIEEPGSGRIVGTYRLLRQDVARAVGRFYSDGEFYVSALVARHPERRFLELGRSCVAGGWRDRRTIELLWQGIWAYALEHGCDVMMGCASLHGTDPHAHSDAFAFLHDHAAAPTEWRAEPRPAAETVRLADHAPFAGSPRAALAALPPLVKGYLRLGGRIGPEAVVDRDFNCIDVFVTLPREAIAARYLRHYRADASRFV